MSSNIEENLVAIATPAKDTPAIKIGNYVFVLSQADPQSREAGTNVKATTAQADKVLQNYLFYTSAGVPTFGTIPTVSATLSANIVTVPKGYISDSQVLIFSSSSVDFYKCTSVGQNTWTGRRAFLSDGIYSFQSDSTEDLFYSSGFIPEVGKIYNSDALIYVASLFEGQSNG